MLNLVSVSFKELECVGREEGELPKGKSSWYSLQ